MVHCILEARSVLGEGALWSPDEGVLWWIDQMRPEIHRFDPRTGVDERIDVALPEQLGALALIGESRLALVASDGLSVIDIPAPARTVLSNPSADPGRASFNDGKCDRQGRLWAGTTDRLETDAVGELFTFDGSGAARRIADGFICSNGPSFSPDGRVMYHTRTHDRAIYAYDINPSTGAAGAPRLFATVPEGEGVPDGSTVDASGYLWSTHWGGGRITRYRPDGTVDRVVEMPVRSPTSCAFGGPEMTTLYVTSASIDMVDGIWVLMDEAGFRDAPQAGGLFAIETGIAGLAEPRFALAERS